MSVPKSYWSPLAPYAMSVPEACASRDTIRYVSTRGLREPASSIGYVSTRHRRSVLGAYGSSLVA
eukprot:1361230-Rhodomonas_salina.2